MDISYVFSNHEEWKTKVVEKGLTVQHLYDLIKDVSVIIGNLRNDEIEDFVFRLKVCHDKSIGKDCDPDDSYRTPMRVSVEMGSRVFYFKLSPTESVFLRQKSRYFCETCGINNTFKIKSMRTHVERVHGKI
jgi:Zn finger protein HypA/HybF involved in hydrogenase expression